MKNIISITLLLSLFLTAFLGNAVWAATFEETVSRAMKTLNVAKGDDSLLMMTNAPYIKVNGSPALSYLDQAQNLTGCTVGKGNLLFYQRFQTQPLRLMLFEKSKGDAVIISRTVDQVWLTETLNISGTVVSSPIFWRTTSNYQAGGDIFTLAGIANAWAKGAPYDLLKSTEIHDHICPGLVGGYLMSHYILKHYPLKAWEGYTVVACPVWCKDDAFQVVMGRTPGKKGLIVKQLSEKQLANITVANPAGMVLIWNYKKKTGKGVALSFDSDRLHSLASKDTPKVGQVVASIPHLHNPDQFVSTAAEFDLDEKLFQEIILAGTNPYELTGLVKK